MFLSFGHGRYMSSRELQLFSICEYEGSCEYESCVNILNMTEREMRMLTLLGCFPFIAWIK